MANATDDIARQIRTGQLKPGPALTDTTLKTMICDRLGVIVSPTTCFEELEVDLREFPTFAARFGGSHQAHRRGPPYQGPRH